MYILQNCFLIVRYKTTYKTLPLEASIFIAVFSWLLINCARQHMQS